jgi:hypothetical protein
LIISIPLRRFVLIMRIRLVIQNLSGHLIAYSLVSARNNETRATREQPSGPACFVHTEASKQRSGGEVMQADTMSNLKPNGSNPQLAASEPLLASLNVANFWRIVPALFGLAAWLPQIGAALEGLGKLPSGIRFKAASGGYLHTTIVEQLGPDGLVLVGALLGAITAYGIWAIARGMRAPRWAAAAAASVWLVLPMFKLAPSPVILPDDAAFAAFMTLAIAALVWTARRENGGLLMVAFVLAIVASLLRPGAAWPAIAIGVAALLSSNNLEEGPWVGMFSSLCWAPGLFIAHNLIEGDGTPASLFAQPSVIDTVRQGASMGAGAIDSATLSLPIVLSFLLAALPFIVFGIAALCGQTIAFLLGGARRRAAVAGTVGTLLCVIGAAGYGSGDAARMLLDPIFLGLAAAIGLVVPALLERLKAT